MILDSAVQIAAKEHRAAKPQPICYQPQKNAQIAKKTGWETKRLYGRGMNGRGMNSHTSLGLIPLPFIPLPNFLASCEHLGLLQYAFSLTLLGKRGLATGLFFVSFSLQYFP
jgi:hypothetical protein